MSAASSDVIVATRSLRKEFSTRRGGQVVAVDDLDLAIGRGGVHGFLGPNGSGKTTTIRMLLGLARASGGEMWVFDEPVPLRLSWVMDRVGAVVEQPKFFPTFTGRANLMLLARSIGIGGGAVDAALERVGLTGRDRERFQGYSLGMKQRLAIAATLLKDPELLILDEPTNGLDPAGIRDIRDMIRRLGDGGVTVLLSSHLLAEVQQVCDSASIIGNGRVLASGRVEDLLGSSAGARVRVGVADPDAAAGHLDTAGYAVTSEEGEHLLVDGADRAEDITRVLAGHGIYVRELGTVRPDLEQVFLQLTQGETLDGGAS